MLQKLIAVGLGIAGVLCAGGLAAQQLIVKGEYGMMGGTTPPPGVYVGGELGRWR